MIPSANEAQHERTLRRWPSALQKDVPQHVVEEPQEHRSGSGMLTYSKVKYAWPAGLDASLPVLVFSWGAGPPRGDAADVDARRGPCQVLTPHRAPREVAEGQLLVDERNGYAVPGPSTESTRRSR